LQYFIPLIFIDGIAGTLFRETAIALSVSIVVSSFVALTLSPMLASKFLTRKNQRQNFIVTKFDSAFKSFSKVSMINTLGYWLNKKKIYSSSFIVFTNY
jgi:multidrug efflux pump subunit AcrB